MKWKIQPPRGESLLQNAGKGRNEQDLALWEGFSVTHDKNPMFHKVLRLLKNQTKAVVTYTG